MVSYDERPPGMTRTELIRNSGDIRLRHAFMSAPPFLSLCRRCGYIEGNRRHRLGTRCSVCYRYSQHFEVDNERRCSSCQP